MMIITSGAIIGTRSGRAVEGATTPIGDEAGWWTFDECAGTTSADLSGHGNVATLVRNATFVPGLHGCAVHTSGGVAGPAGPDRCPCPVTDVPGRGYVRIASPVISSHFPSSVAYDFRLDEPAAPAPQPCTDVELVNNGGDPGMTGIVPMGQISCDGKLRGNVCCEGTDVIGGPDHWAAGEWHHAAFVLDAQSFALYVDGARVAVGTSANTGQMLSNWYLGGNVAYDGGYVNASFDDVRIFSRALSDQEVRALAGAGQATIAMPDVVGTGIVDTPVPLRIEHARDLGAATISMSFDPTVVSVANVTAGDIPGQDITWHVNESAGTLTLLVTTSQRPGATGDFDVAHVTLHAIGPPLSHSTLHLEAIEVVDSNGDPIQTRTRDGSYLVVLPGDANGDGRLDADDLRLIEEVVVGARPASSIHLREADVSGDGAVTGKDALLVRQVLAGTRQAF